MSEQRWDQVLDVRGLACPMPIVKARQSVQKLQPGQVLKVESTDRGSVKDFQGWAQAAADIELVAQVNEAEQGQALYVHYIARQA